MPVISYLTAGQTSSHHTQPCPQVLCTALSLAIVFSVTCSIELLCIILKQETTSQPLIVTVVSRASLNCGFIEVTSCESLNLLYFSSSSYKNPRDLLSCIVHCILDSQREQLQVGFVGVDHGSIMCENAALALVSITHLLDKLLSTNTLVLEVLDLQPNASSLNSSKLISPLRSLRLSSLCSGLNCR